MGFIQEKQDWFNVWKVIVIYHISKPKRKLWSPQLMCKKHCQNLISIPDWKTRQTREMWTVWEGREFGDRDTKENVIDTFKVRDPEGPSEDSGSGSVGGKGPDNLGVELIGLGG